MPFVAVALLVGGCGIPPSGTQVGSTADAPPWTTLSDVATACAEGDPGVAIVTDELRDANTTVELPDCVIHLEQSFTFPYP